MKQSTPGKQTHGQWRQNRSTYQCWQDMKQRCFNERHKQIPNYGGRGVKVTDEWVQSFQQFFADMGPKPAGMTLDRIDNNGPYCQQNCRWATLKTQNNNKRTCVYIEFRGRSQTLTQWANEIGVHYTTLKFRIKSGWGLARSLETPRDDRFAARSKT